MSTLLSSEQIKAEAIRLGFSACGLAPAGAVDEVVATSFHRWLTDSYQAEMAYMQNYQEKRLDPRLLVEGAQTVISVALNYYPENKIPEEEYQIAWYAYGKDYHDVMKAKLNELLEFIKGQHTKIAAPPKIDFSDTDSASPNPPSLSTSVNGRVFCDTAPILERYWAWRAGLGWIGKNTHLIIPHAGSYFFLGEIIVNLTADTYDSPIKNHCGSCTRCLDTCPTNALEPFFRLNSERCLSYLTIEHRGDLPSDMGQKTGKRIYGCDDCQRACPWNRFSRPCQTEEFRPSLSLLQMKKEDWHSLTEEQYKALFKGSAVKRAKYIGLIRNIESAKESHKS